MNILFLFLECCCKVKRVSLSVTKLKCCQHNITMRHEVIQKTIPSMLRLSLWDVFDSSLNPPTRWSSSLHNGKQKKGIKEPLNRTLIFIMRACLCVSYLPSLLTLLSDITAFTRSGTSDKVLNHHSEQGKQLHILIQFNHGIKNLFPDYIHIHTQI